MYFRPCHLRLLGCRKLVKQFGGLISNPRKKALIEALSSQLGANRPDLFSRPLALLLNLALSEEFG